MARFNVYAQRIQTDDFDVEAESYEEAQKLAEQRVNYYWPAGPHDSPWRYDIDETV